MSSAPDTTTLSTKLEENFVSPLTAVRGTLEILRDFPDLDVRQRRRFVESALDECARLERGVEELASAVYAAGRHAHGAAKEAYAPSAPDSYRERLKVDDDADVVEIDFSEFEFSSAKLVNEFFDAIEDLVQPTARRWYFVTNFRDCRVWPEAWVAFAHRGKKIRVNHALGTIRYAEPPTGESGSESAQSDPSICGSRDEALAKIDEMKRAKLG